GGGPPLPRRGPRPARPRLRRGGEAPAGGARAAVAQGAPPRPLAAVRAARQRPGRRPGPPAREPRRADLRRLERLHRLQRAVPLLYRSGRRAAAGRGLLPRLRARRGGPPPDRAL